MKRRHARLVMFGLTLLFDIGVILFCLRAPEVSIALKVVSAVLPWLLLGLCLVPWPRTRATTQGWVGMLVLLLAFTLIAGLLAHNVIR